jgi:hypothetical protein
MNAPAFARANAYLCLVRSAARTSASRDEPMAAALDGDRLIEEAIT